GLGGVFIVTGARSCCAVNQNAFYHRRSDMHSHRFAISDANALRTSDREIPNCRAILEGVMPALKAARTAFNFPCVNGRTTSTRRGSEILGARLLPRRFCSAMTAASNWSSSWSSRCLTAFGKSLGRMWRDGFALGIVSMVAGKDPDGSELRE